MKHSILLKSFIALSLILVSTLPAFAHKVRIFAWEDRGNIITESKFSGGRPAQNTTVSVIDTASGQQLLSGKTNTEGVFIFPTPHAQGDEIEIIIDGGDGHKNSWRFSLQETINNSDSGEHVHQETSSTGDKELKNPNTKEDSVSSSQNISLNRQELTRLIEDALDKKLGPIKRTLAESADKGPTLQDILGGIGYILGLAGIAAYFQSRQKDKE